MPEWCCCRACCRKRQGPRDQEPLVLGDRTSHVTLDSARATNSIALETFLDPAECGPPLPEELELAVRNNALRGVLKLLTSMAMDLSQRFVYDLAANCPRAVRVNEGDAEFYESLHGCTILHVACLWKARKVIDHCISKKPEMIDILTQEGISALHLCYAVNDFAGSNLLEQYGAHTDIRDARGRLPAEYRWRSSRSTVTSRVSIFSRSSNVKVHPSDAMVESRVSVKAELDADEGDKSDDDENVNWIGKTLRCYYCTMPKPSTNHPQQCECGELMSEHPQLPRNVKQLNEKSRFIEDNTNAYGSVQFAGLNQVAEYVRLSDETAEEDLHSLLTTEWNLRKPALVLSVYGDEIIKLAIRDILMKGLLRTASGEGVWLLTSGLESAVVQCVGESAKLFSEAYGRDRIFAIAVAPWKHIRNRQALLRPNTKNDETPMMYEMVHSANPDIENTLSLPLDTNHTHYLFVDTKTAQAGVEGKFRIRFEKLLKELNGDDDTVPMCGILVGGDRSVLRAVHLSVTQNSCPFVLIANSGGIADALTELLDEVNHKKKNKKGLSQKKAAKEETREQKSERYGVLLQECLKIPYDREMENDVKLLEELLEHEHLFEVYDVNNDLASELDKKILSSLLSSASAKNQRETLNMDQLKVCVALDRFDVAMERVFLPGKKWRKGQLDEFMTQALMENKVNFVKLFFEQGFNVDTYLTIYMLEHLYTMDLRANKQGSLSLRRKIGFRKSLRANSWICLEDIGKVLQDFLGSHYKTLYLSPEFLHLNATATRSSHGFERPTLELFLWCVLTKRMEMSEFFWPLVAEPTAASLLAASLFRALQKVTDNADDDERLEQYAAKFENKALGVLDSCYKENAANARENIIRILPFYGEQTCMSLASEGLSIKFIAHRCSQELMELVWKSTIDEETTKFQFIAAAVLGVICPPLVVSTVTYKPGAYPELEEEPTKASETKHLRALVQESKSGERRERRKFMPLRRMSVFFAKLRDFYMAPAVRFTYNTVAYVFFLMLFSYCVLFTIESTTPQVDIVHLILYFWVFTLALEEIRQALLSDTSFRVYLEDTWNRFDVEAILLVVLAAFFYYLGFAERVAIPSYFGILPISPMTVAKGSFIHLTRLFLGISLFLFYLRLLQFYSITAKLGPQVVMIQTIFVEDLLPFMVIFLTFIISYGVFMWSILFPSYYPNITTATKNIYSILRYPYFQAFGDLNVNLMAGDEKKSSCTDSSIDCQDTWGVWIAPIALAIFLAIANILLVNLLIAMLTNTYERIQVASKQYWTLQRFEIMMEFCRRSPIPPPLIILWHLAKFVQSFGKCCTKTGRYRTDAFRKSFEDSPNRERQLIQWEHMRAQDYLREFDEKGRRRKGDQAIVIKGGNFGDKSVNVSKELLTVKDELSATFRNQLKELEERVGRIYEVEDKVDSMSVTLERLEQLLNSRGGCCCGGKSGKRFAEVSEPLTVDSPGSMDLFENASEGSYAGPHENVYVALLKCLASRNETSLRNAGLKGPNSPVLFYQIKAGTNHTFLKWLPLSCTNEARALPDIRDWETELADYEPVITEVVSQTLLKDDNDPANINGFNHLETPRPKAAPVSTDADGATDQTLQWYTQSSQLHGLNRISVTGQLYKIDDQCRPLNPLGRTGLQGRGLLPRWGPNHAMQLLVTRWKRDDKDNLVRYGGERMMEILVLVESQCFIQLPWFLVQHHSDCDLLKCVESSFHSFMRERVEQLRCEVGSSGEVKLLNIFLESVKQSALHVAYSGLVDDPAVNTDHAWVETVLVHIHEQYNKRFDKNILKCFKFSSQVEVAWRDLGELMSLQDGRNALAKSLTRNAMQSLS